jgi:hypothetical protein
MIFWVCNEKQTTWVPLTEVTAVYVSSPGEGPGGENTAYWRILIDLRDGTTMCAWTAPGTFEGNTETKAKEALAGYMTRLREAGK